MLPTKSSSPHREFLRASSPILGSSMIGRVPQLDFDAASGCSSPSMMMRMKNTFLHFEETFLDGASLGPDSPRGSFGGCSAEASRVRSLSDASHLSPTNRERLGSGVLEEIINNLALAFSDYNSTGDGNDFELVMEEDPVERPVAPKALNASQMGLSEQMTPRHLCTTVMLRNIPNKYTQKMLVEHLDDRGFFGVYDFLYLPIDFRNKCNVGYAFINFLDNESLERFKNMFNDYKLPGFNSQKVCQVTYARVQGLEANIEHYKNSPVADVTVPEYRPLVFRK